ncbi:MAG TPA: EamA family transporter RarD [Caulobacteraceae bacterium]|nr:EamA family transporter RarD [Caulobacteraceae bacterium]
MSGPAAASGGGDRRALAAALGCYLIWGAVPGIFILMNRLGASPWEILGQRALWSPLWAGGLVLAAGQRAEALGVFVRPRVFALLACSAVLIGANWAVFIWAVDNGHNIDSSLGYFINPLLNMAVGALIFRERIDAVAWTAIVLAAIGVALQAAALGHLPWISLFLAASFCAYGVIRKRVAASAQTGLFVECLLIAVPGVAYLVWLGGHGGGAFGHGAAPTALLMLAGPLTVAPLALFTWAARRLPFSTLGFLQYIGPTLGFLTGLATGETLTPLRAVSFVFIWSGALVFVFGAFRAARQLRPA